jgi:hypothetical protein
MVQKELDEEPDMESEVETYVESEDESEVEDIEEPVRERKRQADRPVEVAPKRRCLEDHSSACVVLFTEKDATAVKLVGDTIKLGPHTFGWFFDDEWVVITRSFDFKLLFPNKPLLCEFGTLKYFP